jgi:hypothetical protein
MATYSCATTLRVHFVEIERRRHPRRKRGMAFVLSLDKARNVNHAILHDDSLINYVCPALRFKVGKKPLSNGSIILARGASSIDGRQSL